jgi:hypothetical protein
MSGSGRGETPGNQLHMCAAGMRRTSRCSTRSWRATAAPVRQAHDAASLDHAMWFHRPFRADEWLLYAQLAKRPRRPWANPRPDLQARRHAGGVGGAGRLGARAQVILRCGRARPTPFATPASVTSSDTPTESG